MDLDLAVLPKSLRGIYKKTSSSSASQSSSVVFIENPQLFSNDASTHHIHVPIHQQFLADRNGEQLHYQPQTSAFATLSSTKNLPPPCGGEPSTTPSPTSLSPTFEHSDNLQSRLAEQHGNTPDFDALFEQILSVDSGLFHWDDLARYVVEQSSASQQSLPAFRKTLDTMKCGAHTSPVEHEIRIRKLITYYLESKGDTYLLWSVNNATVCVLVFVLFTVHQAAATPRCASEVLRVSRHSSCMYTWPPRSH